MLFALARIGQYKGQIIGRSSQRIFTSGQHKLICIGVCICQLSIVHCNDGSGKLTHRSMGSSYARRYITPLNAYGDHIKIKSGTIYREVYSSVILNFFYPWPMLLPAPTEN